MRGPGVAAACLLWLGAGRNEGGRGGVGGQREGMVGEGEGE